MIYLRISSGRQREVRSGELEGSREKATGIGLLDELDFVCFRRYLTGRHVPLIAPCKHFGMARRAAVGNYAKPQPLPACSTTTPSKIGHVSPFGPWPGWALATGQARRARPRHLTLLTRTLLIAQYDRTSTTAGDSYR